MNKIKIIVTTKIKINKEKTFFNISITILKKIIKPPSELTQA